MASPRAGGHGLRRVVVAANDAAPAPAALSPYEVERAARVARNQQTMAALGVTKAAAALSAPAVWRRAKPGGGGGGERRTKRPAEAAPEPPARVSKRLRVRAGLAEPEADGSASEPEAGAEMEEDRPRMLTVDEYLERKGLPKGASDAQPRAAACTAAAALRVPHVCPTTARATRGNIPRRARRCAAVLASQAAR